MPPVTTKLLWRANGIPVKEYPLHPGLNRIGRAASNDIRIDDSSVSGAHCELWVLEETLQVRDLGSTNGTFVGTRRVTESEIGWGETLKLGGVEFAILNPPAKVTIPVLPEIATPQREFLKDDKTPCCRTHNEVAALFQCTQCGGRWCSACVRQLKRVGGRVMIFCSACGAAAAAMGANSSRKPMSKPLYWLDRIADGFRPRPKYPARKKPRA